VLTDAEGLSFDAPTPVIPSLDHHHHVDCLLPEVKKCHPGQG